MSENLRYPIGEFNSTQEINPEMRGKFIQTIENLPARLREEVKDLDETQLDTPYRQDGWTVRQLIHHVADSHINSFCRFKLGLSEDAPTIKPYDEASWAEMADSKNAQIDLSLFMIDGVHARWTMLLKSMSDADFKREINHPERGGMSLNSLLALYDWHSRHHTAHIAKLRERNNW